VPKITPRMENYLESIYALGELGNGGRVVRAKHVAGKLGVRMSSVTGALRNLAKNGLVEYAPYQPVSLTKKGIEMARNMHQRHRILTSFFTDALGIQSDVAEMDACKLEHMMSKETLRRLLEFMQKNQYSNIAEQDTMYYV
jgi:DtxR family transcriptional regulator, Mn-dependent transcriptional regulator